MSEQLYDPELWRGRAQELRTWADETQNPNSRAVFLQLAGGYDLLADRCEARRNAKNKRSDVS